MRDTDDIVDMFAGRYRLIEQIGTGGMSVVWRGYDEVLGRAVAIKVLAGRFAGDPDFRVRLRREAQATARLTDPRITHVYDFGETADGTPYVVMELVSGRSLAQHLDRAALPWPAVLDIAVQVAEALATAHALGLVHRDITPANIMLTGLPGRDGSVAGRVKVVDFGISALIGEQDGTVAGTPEFLAPEQRAGAPAQPASDVYALGRLLVLALPPGAPLPGEVRDLIDRCLLEDPAARPAAAEVAGVLAAALPATGRPVPPAGGRAGVPLDGGTGDRAGTVPGGPTRMLPPPALGTGTRVLPPRTRRRRRWPMVFALVVVLFAAFVAGVVVARGYPPGPGTSAAGPDGADRAGGPSPRSSSPRRPSPTPRPSCSVAYQSTDLLIGFTARIVVTNTGDRRVSGWTLAFDLPEGERFTLGWGGRWSRQGNRITVRGLAIGGPLRPGGSVTVGFAGSYDQTLRDPDSFTLNGVACRTVAP